ncbi:hypothetical protein AAVH_40791, partial [Aphelenchoides avenae]
GCTLPECQVAPCTFGAHRHAANFCAYPAISLSFFLRWQLPNHPQLTGGTGNWLPAFALGPSTVCTNVTAATQWECQQLLHIHVSPDSESYHTLGALKVRIGENEEVSAESTTWM